MVTTSPAPPDLSAARSAYPAKTTLGRSRKRLTIALGVHYILRTVIFERRSSSLFGFSLALWLSCAAATAHADFAHFESSHVHPIALSEDESALYAVNTPEGKLSIFALDEDHELVLVGDIPVGLEPVSVHVRTPSEVWVVNHLSDSVSVIDVDAMRLTATIHVGDAPTDVIFANGKAYVAVGGVLDQVEVFDATTHAPLTTIEIFGDSPRALAKSNDGSTVYVVVLFSGNQTIAVNRFFIGPNGGLPPPNPPRDPSLPYFPNADLIVKYDEGADTWEDELARDWGFMFNNIALPDYDLFAIDTTTDVVTGTAPHAGTTLFDVVVHPTSDAIFVANTDALNHIRFEPNLRGHFIDTRLSMTTPALDAWTHYDLNSHVDYGVTPGPTTETELSTAHPGDSAFSGDGTRLYLTAFGSAKVVVLDPATGQILDRIDVGEGPSGVALSDARERLYVVNRFTNTISVVDSSRNDHIREFGIAGHAAFDPSPDEIKLGRKLLYDGRLSSGHGDASCASCHVFGDLDQLAWDLGDPQGAFLDYDDTSWLTPSVLTAPAQDGFHPMKGPMATQTLRGLPDVTPLHWRGDKPDIQAFNPAFVGLMGRATQIPTGDMDLFATFLDTILMPPNPNRLLDDTLPMSLVVDSIDGGGATVVASPTAGLNTWVNETLDGGVFSCNDCHTLPLGTSNELTGGGLTAQDVLVAQTRNTYLKRSFNVIRNPNVDGINVGTLEQKGGFGIFHNGTLGLLEFLRGFIFIDDTRIHNLEAFLMAHPSDVAPCVGHQITVTPATKSDGALIAEIGILLGQAGSNCDVVVKGNVAGNPRGYLYDSVSEMFLPDFAADPLTSETSLRMALVGSDVLTYTGLVVGTGLRAGIDRDRDTVLDFDEVSGGSDDADPGSVPVVCAGGPALVDKAQIKVRKNLPPFGDEKLTIKGEFTLSLPIAPTLDPLSHGLNFEVQTAGGTTLMHRRVQAGVSPARGEPGWKVNGTGTTWKFKDAKLLAPGGIKKAKIRDRGNGIIAFTIGGKAGDFHIEQADLPLRLAITLGALAQNQAGQCATHAFAASECAIASNGNAAKCK